MKNLKLFILNSLLVYSLAHAGEKGGNGGTVVVCADHVGLADFEELQIRPGLKGKLSIPETDESIQIQMERALKKITDHYPFLSKPISDEWTSIQSRIVELDGKYEWTVTDDLGTFPLPIGCTLKNAILYIDNGPIEIQNKLLNQLSNTHLAGIWVHEILWKLTRERTNQTTTLAARRMTAMLFAENSDYEILYSLVNQYLAPEDVDHFLTIQLPDQIDMNRSFFNVELSSNNGYRFALFSEINDEEINLKTIGNNSTKLKGLKIGDYLFIKMRGFSGTTYDFVGKLNIWTNTDPKPNKSRRRYTALTKHVGELKARVIGGYGEAKYFLGIISPKMKPYMNGLL